MSLLGYMAAGAAGGLGKGMTVVGTSMMDERIAKNKAEYAAKLLNTNSIAKEKRDNKEVDRRAGRKPAATETVTNAAGDTFLINKETGESTPVTIDGTQEEMQSATLSAQQSAHDDTVSGGAGLLARPVESIDVNVNKTKPLNQAKANKVQYKTVGNYNDLGEKVGDKIISLDSQGNTKVAFGGQAADPNEIPQEYKGLKHSGAAPSDKADGVYWDHGKKAIVHNRQVYL